MARRHDVPLVDLNKEAAVNMTLERALLHKNYACPRRIDDADFKIWMPKLKYHICCQVTQALKKAKAGAIVTGIYEGDVDAGNGVCVLLGACTNVSGTIRARKIKRISGCPIGAVKTASLLPLYLGLPHPFLNIRDDVNMVTNTAIKVWHQLRNGAL